MSGSIRMLATTACVLAVFATACGGGSQQSSSTSTPATTTASTTAAPTAGTSAPAAGAQITIEGFKYNEITVAPGAEVTVVNKDSAEHTVTSDTAGAFDKEVHGGETVTFTAPTQPGTYPYHCTYHPSMHGTLIVK
jgi:plastocyanin